MTKRKIFLAVILAIASFSGAPTTSAQIRMNLNSEVGALIPFLPDYNAASIVDGGFNPVLRNAFRSEIIDLGTNFALDGRMHCPSDPRWTVDFDLNLASANSTGSTQFIADPGPGQTVWMASLDGLQRISSLNGGGATFSLDSDALYYREYFGIRRQFDTSQTFLDYFDFGGGFTHSAIEQEHLFVGVFNNGASGQYIEDLDTNYLGGEIRTKMIKQIAGLPVVCDWGIGFLWMHGDYAGTSNLLNAGGGLIGTATANEQIDTFAVSIDVTVQTETAILGRRVRPGLNFRYLSDVAAINHPQTEVTIEPDPVSLTTDPGFFLGLNLEICLY